MGITSGLARSQGGTGVPDAGLKLGEQAEVRRAIKKHDKTKAKAKGIGAPKMWRFSYWSDSANQCLDALVTASSITEAVRLVRLIYPTVKKSVVEYHTRASQHRHFHCKRDPVL